MAALELPQMGHGTDHLCINSHTVSHLALGKGAAAGAGRPPAAVAADEAAALRQRRNGFDCKSNMNRLSIIQPRKTVDA